MNFYRELLLLFKNQIFICAPPTWDKQPVLLNSQFLISHTDSFILFTLSLRFYLVIECCAELSGWLS